MSNTQTLFVRNLIFSGIHGSTGRERLDSQRFQVDLSINLDISRSVETDSLQDTYDYKSAADIAGEIIEKENHVLIEKIASRIASRICSDPKVQSAKVTIRKIDANENGVPGIIVEKKRKPLEMNDHLHDFDIQHFLKTLDADGGISIPILTEEYRCALLEEAENYNYEKQPEIVGPAKVREQLSSTYDLKSGSLFFRLKNDFENLLKKKTKRFGISIPNPARFQRVISSVV